jgi:hypothetical protein
VPSDEFESNCSEVAGMTCQVKLKTSKRSKDSVDIVLRDEDVGGLVQGPSLLTITFRSKFELDAAFIAAGIYLRDASHLD